MKKITEDKLQQECVMWFNNNFCLKKHGQRCIIFAVPNGGSRNAIEAKKFKNTGLLRGVSDLVLVLPSEVLFVELKTVTGVQSTDQKEFEDRVSKLGYRYILCRSLDEFKSIFL